MLWDNDGTDDTIIIILLFLLSFVGQTALVLHSPFEQKSCEQKFCFCSTKEQLEGDDEYIDDDDDDDTEMTADMLLMLHICNISVWYLSKLFSFL